MPATYSATSTILNVDTKSLADQPQGDFYGYTILEWNLEVKLVVLLQLLVQIED